MFLGLNESFSPLKQSHGELSVIVVSVLVQWVLTGKSRSKRGQQVSSEQNLNVSIELL